MNKTLTFDSKIIEMEQTTDPLLSRVKIRVCYWGLNRNNSNIAKDVIVDALPTIYNKPIVGEYFANKEDFGGHGGKLANTPDGLEIVPTTIPYGLINDKTEISWETLPDENGVDREYLCATGYIWTGRYKELESVVENSKGQSMEIEILESEFIDIDGQQVEDIKKFIFSGFCILGDDVEPCFEDANIAAFTLEEAREYFKREFFSMVSELKEHLEREVFESKKIEIDNSADSAVMSKSWSNPKAKLWDTLLEASNAKELVDEAYLIVDEGWKDSPSTSLHYPHHSLKNEKLVVNKKGVESAFARLMQNDPDNEEAKKHLLKHYRELGLDTSGFEFDDEDDNEKFSKGGKSVSTKFSYTSEQLEAELRRLLSSVQYDGNWWTCSRFDYQDHNETNVYAYDFKLGFNVGMPYTIDGDKVSIDTENMFRIQFSPDPLDLPIEDHDGDDISVLANFAKKFKAEKDTQDEDFKKLEAELEDYKKQVEEMSKAKSDADENYASLKKQYDDLQDEFKKAIDEADKAKMELDEFKKDKEQADEFALYERFSGQFTEEEFESAKESMVGMSLEQKEEKLFALLGKKNAKFSKNGNGGLLGVKVFNKNNTIDPYGGLLSESK